MTPTPAPKGISHRVRVELEQYPISTMCFGVSAAALLAAVVGGLINVVLAEVLSVIGMGIVGMFYLALGVWHRVQDIPVTDQTVQPAEPPIESAAAQSQHPNAQTWEQPVHQDQRGALTVSK